MAVQVPVVGSEGRVKSRVAWGAIFAGMLVAMATFLFFGAVWAAIDFSLPNGLGASTPVVMLVLSLVGMVIGGMITARLSAGENQQEAMLYGVIMWSATAVLLLLFAVNGTTLLGSSTILGQLGGDEYLPVSRGAAWWAAVGVGLSMLAAVVGSWLGFMSQNSEVPMRTFGWRSWRRAPQH